MSGMHDRFLDDVTELLDEVDQLSSRIDGVVTCSVEHISTRVRELEIAHSEFRERIQRFAVEWMR